MTTTNAQRHRGGPHDTTAHFCCGQHNYYRHDRSDKQISTSDKKNDRIDEKNVPMLPFFPKFDTERVYGNRVRIIWFEPMFSQSSYNMEQVAMSSNACTLIAVLMAINVHQMQVILNEEYLSSRMIGCLGHSMLEGNKIYESLKIRKMLKHSNLNVPEAIQHASQPNNGLKEWKVIVVMQPLAKALFEHLKSNWIEWTKQFDKYDCYHRDLYIILIADARSVLFCIQYNSDMIGLVDSHQHSSNKGAFIAISRRSRLKFLCAWYSATLYKYYRSEPKLFELTFLHFKPPFSTQQRKKRIPDVKSFRNSSTTHIISTSTSDSDTHMRHIRKKYN